ncbi:MAG: methyltransferase domain-containing protein [Ornithinimicrobium sp.]
MKHRTLWAAVALAGTAGYAAHRASLGKIRGPQAVKRLYDRLAPAYDVTAWIFRPLGASRLQERAVDLLDLHAGDTVVDLGCGTGINLPVLADAVGEHGHVIGIDLSAGMLEQARRRADRHNLSQVTLIQEDIRSVRLPPGTTAVLASGSLEMVPEYDVVIRGLAGQLSPHRGRLAVGGFRRPPAWPAWAVAFGRAATALFGVTRAYENIQPWRSVRQHMDEIGFDTAAGGALYLIVARATSPSSGGDTEPVTVTP